ncbi:MAG TPA: amidohydrolase, partial [Sphingomicrobium sp.]|nr:amidohydrolase [Sphingomicrobium sp.]
MVSNRGIVAATAAALFVSGCATTKPPEAPPIHINEDPYPSTYVRYPGALTVLRHATVFTGDGQQINDGT